MPGNGPLPKPDGQRRTRVKPSFDLIQLPAEGFQGPIPDPLFKLDGAAVNLWFKMWRSPVATQFTDDDIPALSRMVHLQCQTELAGVEMTEVRQLEDRFGLNPAARRKLRWVIVDDPADEKPETPKPNRYEGLKAAN